jgi:inosine-uridine nucleoside N-ribohydrolase
MSTNFISKNKKTKIWLDLELREDIDDYITLIFALENNLNITEISIHNPSINELTILNKTLKDFNKEIPVIISGDITVYAANKDIHRSLELNIKNISPIDVNNLTQFRISKLDDYLPNVDMQDKIVFCGGSLFTLQQILKNNQETNIDTYIQGGYAGEAVVGAENVLKKFKKRDKVPTWNLNLDLEATDLVMAATNVRCHFISKNVCHASWLDVDDLNSNDNQFNKVLKEYFAHNKHSSKCMHDLVAFLTIFNDELVQFKTVDLVRTDDERAKWHSELNESSNKQISCSLNFKLFQDVIKKYDTSKKKQNKLKL